MKTNKTNKQTNKQNRIRKIIILLVCLLSTPDISQKGQQRPDLYKCHAGEMPVSFVRLSRMQGILNDLCQLGQRQGGALAEWKSLCSGAVLSSVQFGSSPAEELPCRPREWSRPFRDALTQIQLGLQAAWRASLNSNSPWQTGERDQPLPWGHA